MQQGNYINNRAAKLWEKDGKEVGEGLKCGMSGVLK
jgi:hypothetical protein